MTENYIKINTTSEITDELATEKDKRKAYQIFLYSAILSGIFTTAMYFLSTFIS